MPAHCTRTRCAQRSPRALPHNLHIASPSEPVWDFWLAYTRVGKSCSYNSKMPAIVYVGQVFHSVSHQKHPSAINFSCLHFRLEPPSARSSLPHHFHGQVFITVESNCTLDLRGFMLHLNRTFSAPLLLGRYNSAFEPQGCLPPFSTTIS